MFRAWSSVLIIINLCNVNHNEQLIEKRSCIAYSNKYFHFISNCIMLVITNQANYKSILRADDRIHNLIIFILYNHTSISNITAYFLNIWTVNWELVCSIFVRFFVWIHKDFRKPGKNWTYCFLSPDYEDSIIYLFDIVIVIYVLLTFMFSSNI